MPYMDKNNADRLINTYADMILRISYMYLKQTNDAEDICQDMFLKLLTGDYQFDSVSHEKAWIIRATVNACKDRLRTAFWKHAVDLDKAAGMTAPEKPKSELLDLVMKLPKNYRVSIYLYYYENYSVNEIAAMFGKSQNTVSAYLSRGRKRLKSLMEDDRNQWEAYTKGAKHYVQKF